MELFLNSGRRVYFKEVGGLFSKRAGLKRYLQIRAIGSRSDGSDWIGPRSNRDRWNRIGGPWEFGRVGRRRDSPESISRGGGSPGLANPSPQGSIRPGFGSGADFAIRVIHPGLLLGSGMAGAACTAKGAVSAAAPAGVRCPSCSGAGLCVQSEQGARAGLKQSKTGFVRGYARLQGIHHGGAMVCAAVRSPACNARPTEGSTV